MQQASVSDIHHTASLHWRFRFRNAGIHLGISALIALIAALLVFAVWYPYPYSEISGGRDLFLLVISVDVVLGPLVTLAISSPAKARRLLKLDFAVIGLLQLVGLAYGLWTVHIARPVHTVFEYDRFRVIHQIEIPPEDLHRAAPGIDAIPLGAPTFLSLRAMRNADEEFDYTMAGMAGMHVSARPELWEPYEAGRERILAAARPVSALKSRFPQRSDEIDAAVRKAGRDPQGAAYLPLIARKAEAWTVLLDAGSAEVIGFLPLDSF